MDSNIRLFPHQASSVSHSVDALYFFLLAVTIFFVGLICILIMGFAVRYRRKARVDRSNPPESYVLEIGWSIIPFVLSMIMFVWGAVVFFQMQRIPPNADEIYVVGKQWMWKIQHSNGKREINELHLPVGRPVRLKMISEDVIHNFFVPDFRMKMDVLPGRYTQMAFTPTKVGSFHLFCAEYCGTSHSQMIGKVVVMEPADFAAWLSSEGDANAPKLTGEQLFAQYRCDTCHKTTGGRCPPLEGIYGKQQRLANGRTVIVDDAYLRESILDPRAKVTEGYQALMPTYKGQISEDGILQIISYIKSLSPEADTNRQTEPTNAEATASEAADAAEADN